MLPRHESRTRALLARLSSVPGDPEEGRALLQRRVSTFLGFTASLWLVTWPVDFFLGLVASPSAFVGLVIGLFAEPMSVVHLCTAVGLALSWGLLRRAPRSLDLLVRIDGIATMLQAGALGYFLTQGEPVYRLEATIVLGLVHILVTRAAVIPSRPRRTMAIGLGASLTIVAATAYLYTSRPTVPNAPSPMAIIVVTAVWCLISVATTTLISAVIYGLETRVRAAMALGQYRLEEKIGEGGMGIVYRASHALLRRPTAIKILPAERAGDASVAHFEREVQITSTLNHPNIVAVYDYGRSPDGVFYYAMEYLDGLDLELLVREGGPLPPARVLHILKQATEALGEAHAVDLIHRDVKPANMVLCDRPRRHDHLKLVDFGLVKKLSGATAESHESDVATFKGTPVYMSPEAIAYPEKVDGRSDIYALGAVAYFLLSGVPVFDGATIVAVCSQHLHATVTPIKERTGRDVPAKLEAVLLRCLAKKAEDRYPSASDLADALATCDEVPAWTQGEAAAWWRDRAPEILGKRKRAQPVSPDWRTLPVGAR